jgi:hypothetical protein
VIITDLACRRGGEVVLGANSEELSEVSTVVRVGIRCEPAVESRHVSVPRS